MSRAVPCLNEVQFPKELQPSSAGDNVTIQFRLNEVQFPKELQPGLRRL